MFEVFFAPVAAALVIGTVFLAATKGKFLPRSFGDTFPHFLTGALAGFLGVVAPMARIADVEPVIRAIPLIGFAVIAVAAYIAGD